MLALGLSSFVSCTTTASEVAHESNMMATEERRVQKKTNKKKGSKTSKPTNQPTISAAPTVSAAPTSAKSAKKNAAKSKKTNTAPTPVPCSENFCINDCVDAEGTCYEAPSVVGICSVCYAQGEGLDCTCNPPRTTDLFN